MANFNKNTPEYKIFHQYQSDICNGLSRLPDSITPLAQSLCSAGIIMPSTMTGLSAPGLTPFDRANRVMTAAGTSIEQDVSNFEIVLEKLDDQGLSGLVDNMYGSLDGKIQIFYCVRYITYTYIICTLVCTYYILLV